LLSIVVLPAAVMVAGIWRVVRRRRIKPAMARCWKTLPFCPFCCGWRPRPDGFYLAPGSAERDEGGKERLAYP
jgi:hypothetical protein